VIWFTFALVVISAPMAYLIQRDAKRAMIKARWRKQLAIFNAHVLTAAEVLREIGFAADKAREAFRRAYLVEPQRRGHSDKIDAMVYAHKAYADHMKEKKDDHKTS
jgi:hypothetical protein